LVAGVDLNPRSAVAGFNLSYQIGGDPPVEQADFFKVPSSASYFLDGIEVAVGIDTPQSPRTMVFNVMSDANGRPGVTLESFTFSGIEVTGSFAGVILSAQSSLRPTL
jgi:hypothetical protein